MAFDGMMTYAITAELASELAGGKITKIYQPMNENLFSIFVLMEKIINYYYLLTLPIPEFISRRCPMKTQRKHPCSVCFLENI